MNIQNKHIALIDDDEGFLKVYSHILKSNGYVVKTASNGTDGIQLVKTYNFPLVIMDMVMPGLDGLEVLKAIKELDNQSQIIILTAEGSITNAVEAMRYGAYTYVTKPINIEELLLLIERAYQFYLMSEENKSLKDRIKEIEGKELLLGNSQAIMNIKDTIQNLVSTTATVLITGESGTGKEIVANLIHYNSERAKGPFIKVNCAALSENLLESELFGHEKGAFTGAISTKRGRFELADIGSIFLDEIGELSLNIQSKLLRILQEKEFERVGGTISIKTDFRLIVATNKNLREEVKKGNFREDLFYRISVVPIHIPPLRERCEDIQLLLEHFLEVYKKEMLCKDVSFNEEVIQLLQHYKWPGNVRELKNIVERLLVFVRNRPIEIRDLPEETKRKSNSSENNPRTLQQAKKLFEKDYILKVLKRNGGNITLTAKEIGIARKNLQIKMKEHGLRDVATKK